MKDQSAWMLLSVDVAIDLLPNFKFSSDLISEIWKRTFVHHPQDSMSRKWSLIQKTKDGYQLLLTVKESISEEISSKSDKIVSMVNELCNIEDKPSRTSINSQKFQGINAVSCPWVCLQVMVSSSSNHIPKLTSHDVTRNIMNNLQNTLGREVIARSWSFNSALPNGVCFNIAIPQMYIEIAKIKLNDKTTGSILSKCTGIQNNLSTEIEVANFFPHMMAKPYAADRCQATRYTVTDFCYAITDSNEKLLPEEVEQAELSQIVQASLQAQAPMIGANDLSLNDDNFRAVLFDYDPDSLQYIQVTDNPEKVACTCTMTFSMNIDLVGPFKIGHIDAFDSVDSTIIERTPCQSTFNDGMEYNCHAFGDIFDIRLQNFGGGYRENQSQVAIYRSSAQSMEALGELCLTVGHFLENSKRSELFPVSCFELQPVANEESDTFCLNLGFYCSDSVLVREFHFALNQIRLSTSNISTTTDSFSPPYFAPA
ncbi:hypothetical protein AB6E94_19570 [Vibrio lentus]|uniref:hypothetical protein n=1 Tax=Vibrio splendidus TaxID=29497 RepID=UPI000C852025|nr:hypothetical protein [Vibrio splendidus]PMG17902.1 hypothetical protein BCU98_00790 [Vibrio splendidus]